MPLVIGRHEGEEVIVSLCNEDGTETDLGTIKVILVNRNYVRLSFALPKQIKIVRPEAREKFRSDPDADQGS